MSRKSYKRGLEDVERVVDAYTSQQLLIKRKEKEMKLDPKDPDIDEENMENDE